MIPSVDMNHFQPSAVQSESGRHRVGMTIVPLFLARPLSGFGMFVRFINHERDVCSHQKRGVFQIAYNLLQADEIPLEQWCHLKAAVRWFEQHLTIPETSKLDQRAIFWFKTDGRNS